LEDHISVPDLLPHHVAAGWHLMFAGGIPPKLSVQLAGVDVDRGCAPSLRILELAI
jgi:hypothetical protein